MQSWLRRSAAITLYFCQSPRARHLHCLEEAEAEIQATGRSSSNAASAATAHLLRGVHTVASSDGPNNTVLSSERVDSWVVPSQVGSLRFGSNLWPPDETFDHLLASCPLIYKILFPVNKSHMNVQHRFWSSQGQGKCCQELHSDGMYLVRNFLSMVLMKWDPPSTATTSSEPCQMCHVQ